MKKRLIAQGKPFAFTPENLKNAQILIQRYPEGRQASAIVPLLDLAQRQSQGWLPREAVEYVAEYLGVSLMQGYEVATFYSMFNLGPVGKYFIQVCTTTPCQLRGSQEILKVCQDTTCTTSEHADNDELFSIIEVECLGACVNAPVIQINDDYYENLTPKKTSELIIALKSGQDTTLGVPHQNIYISEAGTKGVENLAGDTKESASMSESSKP